MSWGLSPKNLLLLLKINDQSVLYSTKEKLPIVKHENLFEIIYEYYQTVGHLGRDKT